MFFFIASCISLSVILLIFLVVRWVRNQKIWIDQDTEFTHYWLTQDKPTSTKDKQSDDHHIQ